MKLSHKIILWIFVIFNFVTNIILLVLSYPRSHDNYGFDYMGIIVGILSLLVTLLVAWNIYSALDIKRELNRKDIELNREIKKQYEKQSSEISDVFNKFKNRIEKGEALLQANIACANAASIDNTSIDKNYLFILHSLKAIVLWSHTNEYSNANSSIELLIKVLKGKKLALRKNQIIRVNGLLAEINNPKMIDKFDDLDDFIKSLKKSSSPR